jgi:hypothetical protein
MHIQCKMWMSMYMLPSPLDSFGGLWYPFRFFLATTQTVQAESFGLLSPHFPLSLAVFSARTSAVSSSQVQMEKVLSLVPVFLILSSIRKGHVECCKSTSMKCLRDKKCRPEV